MRPAISEDTILAAVTRDFGHVSAVHRVSPGEESLAFGIRVGGEEFIVRANRSPSGFHKDAYCHQQFGSAALPIPEIVLIGETEDLPYCISRRAAGVTLQDLAPAALPGVTAAVAQAMQAIADAPLPETAGFGPFDSRGVGEHTHWRDFLAAVADPHRYDWSRVNALVSSRWCAEHMSKLQDLLSGCPETRRLVHADFGSNNVLTDGVTITGVIDWSEAMFGDPLYDAANIFFWRPWLACMEAQARFLEDHCPDLSHDALALGCYQLRIGLAQVYECAIAKEIPDLCWAMKRCDEVAARLRPRTAK